MKIWLTPQISLFYQTLDSRQYNLNLEHFQKLRHHSFQPREVIPIGEGKIKKQGKQKGRKDFHENANRKILLCARIDVYVLAFKTFVYQTFELFFEFWEYFISKKSIIGEFQYCPRTQSCFHNIKMLIKFHHLV